MRRSKARSSRRCRRFRRAEFLPNEPGSMCLRDGVLSAGRLRTRLSLHPVIRKSLLTFWYEP